MDEEIRNEKGEKIVPIVPNKELKKWKDFLEENNFLKDEIRGILSHLNKNYYKKIKSIEKGADKKVEELDKRITKEHKNCVLSKEEKRFLRELTIDRDDMQK
jgi:Txe/YoeB family toxin of Txe-Axe toxin-antitoxin module